VSTTERISMPVEELHAHCRSMEDVCLSYETVLARLREERTEGLPADVAGMIAAELERAASRVRALADEERQAAATLRQRVEAAIRAAEAPADPGPAAGGAAGVPADPAGATAPAAAPASEFAELPEAGDPSSRAADPSDPDAYDPTADTGEAPADPAADPGAAPPADPAAAPPADPAAAAPASGGEFPADGTPADMLAYASKRAVELGLVITSTTGGVHTPGSYHYQGRAIDVAGPPPAMAAFYTEFAGTMPTELFYDPLGAIKNGAPIPPIGGHTDHVHIAY
jgi:hypothetical protein